MMVQQGRQADATNLLNTWVATQSYSPMPHIEMAWLQQQQGNQTAAAQSLQTALKIQPNHPTALAQLGDVYQKSGQPELAAAYYQRSLQNNWRQPGVQTRLSQLNPQATPGPQGQIAFGIPQSMRQRMQGNSPQMAWQAPQNQVAASPTPLPTAATTAAVPPQAQIQAQAQNISPQVQTVWMPPKTSVPQAGMQAMAQPANRVQPGPTPVAMPQPNLARPYTAQQPTPVATPSVANADPAACSASCRPTARRPPILMKRKRGYCGRIVRSLSELCFPSPR